MSSNINARMNAYLKSRPKNLKKNELEALAVEIASAANNSNIKKHSANLNRLMKSIAINEALTKYHGQTWTRNRMRNFINGVTKPTHAHLPFLVKIANKYNKSGNSLLADAANAVIIKIPLKNWAPKPYAGKILFHGSPKLIRHGYPDSENGNWFAESVHQSVLHAFARSNSKNAKKYLYVYHVRPKPPKLIEINTERNFENLGMNLVRTNRENGNWAFTNANYQVAESLCEYKVADGWRFIRDQTQVMLCNPKKFLRLHKAYEITGRAPSDPSFRTSHYNGKSAMWFRAKGTVYGLKQIWPKLTEPPN